jgi:hypothetical protein
MRSRDGRNVDYELISAYRLRRKAQTSAETIEAQMGSVMMR